MNPTRRLNQFHVSMNSNTNDMDELRKQVNNLIAYIKYLCETQKKDWFYRLHLVGSEHNPRFTMKREIKTGKRGRPKKIIQSFTKENSTLNPKPHAHMLIKCMPSASLMKEIKGYWQKRNGEKTFNYSQANSGVLGYFEQQDSFTRTAKYDPVNAIGDWDEGIIFRK